MFAKILRMLLLSWIVNMIAMLRSNFLDYVGWGKLSNKGFELFDFLWILWGFLLVDQRNGFDTFYDISGILSENYWT